MVESLYVLEGCGTMEFNEVYYLIEQIKRRPGSFKRLV